MRDAKEIVTDVLGLEGDLSAGRNGFEVYCAERDSAIVELECDRADAYAFALALALLTWLHGSQASDARAELDAWIRAGIEAHVYGSAICDESGKPVSVEELNEWAKVKP